jgi:hypothetical protein
LLPLLNELNNNSVQADNFEKFLSHDDIQKIFSTIEEIYECNLTLFKKLKVRVVRWNRDSLIGDVFIDVVCEQDFSLQKSRFFVGAYKENFFCHCCFCTVTCRWTL